jgi:hypothetical protein
VLGNRFSRIFLDGSKNSKCNESETEFNSSNTKAKLIMKVIQKTVDEHGMYQNTEHQSETPE